MAYTHNGIEYPSVTQILGLLGKGDALNYWAAGCACDFIKERKDQINDPHFPWDEARAAFKTASQAAMDIGTAVHKAIEAWIKNGEDYHGDNDKVASSLLAFHEWESKNSVKWVKSEITLINEKIGYAGTCDAIAIINGVEYLVDFKTSKAVYDEYKFQLAAYNGAADKPRDLAILRVDKETGDFEFVDVSRGWEKRLNAFYALVDYYYLAATRRLKNNPRVTK